MRCLLTASNQFPAPDGLRYVSVGSRRELLPPGTAGELALAVVGDRYRDADEAFAWADIVHAEELSFWFSADAARRRRAGRFALVETVWETLPMLNAFRNRQARRNRALVLAETDLFLPATERAALALRLEGVDEERIRVCAPGIDTGRFAAAGISAAPEGSSTTDGVRTDPAGEHTLISPGRLVWEKGHQDVLRALALLHRGARHGPRRRCPSPPARDHRLRPRGGTPARFAHELGLSAAVHIGSVGYEEMPARFAAASAMVLGSQAVAAAARHPFDIPRMFWEEQFGLVLAEAMASGLDILSTTSGAIPEVVAGTPAQLVAPGDWPAIAAALAAGPLSRAPGLGFRIPRSSCTVTRRAPRRSGWRRPTRPCSVELGLTRGGFERLARPLAELHPGEARRPLPASLGHRRAQPAVAEHLGETAADVIDVAWVNVDGGVAADLGQRGNGGGHHGSASGHRLEHGQAKPLAQRRVAEHRTAAVELGQGGVRHMTEREARDRRASAGRSPSARSTSRCAPTTTSGCAAWSSGSSPA